MPTLIPPSAETGTFSDGKIRGNAMDLWRYYTFPQGLAIVKHLDGAWGLEPAVAVDEALEWFQGGMVHEISAGKAAELIAAGFGDYIHSDNPIPGDPPGYGQGGYGEGGYGS